MKILITSDSSCDLNTNQLEEFNLAEIKISPINTYTEKNYASHVAAFYGDKSKLGQNIVGFYYKDAK